MYTKLLSAAAAAGLFAGTCDSSLSAIGRLSQEPTLSVAADSDFDLGLGGKLALLRDEHEPPPPPPNPPDCPDGVDDPYQCSSQ